MSVPVSQFKRPHMAVDDKNRFVEGYWASGNPDQDVYNGHYPFPESGAVFPQKAEFLARLKQLENSDGIVKVVSYRVSSRCRLCGKTNGYREYEYWCPGVGLVAWPEGYIHYVDAHDVWPSWQFYQIVFGEPVPSTAVSAACTGVSESPLVQTSTPIASVPLAVASTPTPTCIVKSHNVHGSPPIMTSTPIASAPLAVASTPTPTYVVKRHNVHGSPPPPSAATTPTQTHVAKGSPLPTEQRRVTPKCTCTAI